MVRCLHDRMRYYHFEDLVEVVRRKLERYEFYPVSQRTMQKNLKFMQSGEGLQSNAGDALLLHMKIYTYETRWLLLHEPAMANLNSELLSAAVIPNKELSLAIMMYADQM